ncbi:MAG: hypothetical protein EXR49_00060 [Dehalococcoidia bacterium]|nr:hypothetical protein [Dehalococcoidia bacterium]
MPSIENLVEFSKRWDDPNSRSPWREFDDLEYDRFRLAWNTLFPRQRRDGVLLVEREQDDPWQPELPGDLMGQLEVALAAPPPSEDEIREMAASQDWDRCAWYQPIHNYGRAWGIFIEEGCILQRTKDIARFLWSPTPLTRPLARVLLRVATYSYFLHEHYHHKVESLAFRLEVVDRSGIYGRYQRRVYRPALGTDHLLEEALANADALHRLSDQPYRTWIGKQVVDATRSYLEETFPFNPLQSAWLPNGIQLLDAGHVRRRRKQSSFHRSRGNADPYATKHRLAHRHKVDSEPAESER